MKQNTKEQVLKALSEAEEFLSGQELSNLLGVSRTAVWKAIGKLKEEGYEIEAVTNKGYRLAHDQETDILNRKLKSGSQQSGRDILFSVRKRPAPRMMTS